MQALESMLLRLRVGDEKFLLFPLQQKSKTAKVTADDEEEEEMVQSVQIAL